jgi:3-hydroxyisobutyrate dehydrogenase-like beta-hydroxyacid dehydrogenase
MSQTTVALLHPGEMGSAVGAAARARGAHVIWASEGRSTPTANRAVASGIEDVGTLAALIAQANVIVSVCPPAAAFEMARSVAARRFPGMYLDANAVSPATAREIAATIESAGGTFVDGGIIGPPPTKRGMARLYLSGREAARAAALFDGSPLEAIALNAPAGAASALKMAHASWTKGSAALLIAVRALALAEGIEADLLAEWQRSIPDLASRSDEAVRRNARKAWRFVGEMDEIAETFAAAGLPDGFPLAAREIYQRLEAFKDSSQPPSFAEAVRIIRACAPPAPSNSSAAL